MHVLAKERICRKTNAQDRSHVAPTESESSTSYTGTARVTQCPNLIAVDIPFLGARLIASPTRIPILYFLALFSSLLPGQKMVRGRDACWEHCVLVDATKQKVRCNYCHREFSGGVYRMKFHLAQIKNKDIVPCTEVPNDVRDSINSILSTPKKQKDAKKLKTDNPSDGSHSSSTASGAFHVNSNGESSGQHESTRLAIIDDVQKQKHDEADKKIARFFFHNSIPFTAAQSGYYQYMIDAIAECGSGYIAPSYEDFVGSLI